MSRRLTAQCPLHNLVKNLCAAVCSAYICLYVCVCMYVHGCMSMWHGVVWAPEDSETMMRFACNTVKINMLFYTAIEMNRWVNDQWMAVFMFVFVFVIAGNSNVSRKPDCWSQEIIRSSLEFRLQTTAPLGLSLRDVSFLLRNIQVGRVSQEKPFIFMVCLDDMLTTNDDVWLPLHWYVTGLPPQNRVSLVVLVVVVLVVAVVLVVCCCCCSTYYS